MGPGQHDLGTFSAPADLHHVNADAVALLDGLAGDLLRGVEHRFGVLPLAGKLQDGAAVAGIDAGDHRGEDLVLLAGVLVGDHAPLRLADALDDDLLGGGGGDAAEIPGLDIDADLIPQLRVGRIGPGLLQRHFRGGVLHILHHGLDGLHGDGARLLIDVDKHIVQRGALGVALIQRLVGRYQCLRDPVQHVFLPNTLFLLQVFQCLNHLTCHDASSLSPRTGRPAGFCIFVFLTQNSKCRRTRATSAAAKVFCAPPSSTVICTPSWDTRVPTASSAPSCAL